jgi:hypothetical protein
MYYDFHELIVMISMINIQLKESFIETLLRGSENRCDFNGDLVIPIKVQTKRINARYAYPSVFILLFCS